jgi:hypothetical protein
MRIRPAHIVVAVLALIAAFVLYAALTTGPAGTEPPVVPAAPGNLPPAGADQEAVPVMEVETDTFKMGVVDNDKATTKELMITNPGRRTLEIKDITSSCACTIGEMEQTEIRPGQSAPLKVTIYPNRIPGFYSHKTLTIMSNAGADPMKKIDVIAKIDPEFSVEPEKIEFGEVEKGQTVKRNVLLRQVGAEAIELLNVKPLAESQAGVTFTYEKRPESEWLEAGKPEYDITAELQPWAPIGKIKESFQIITTCKRVPRFRCLYEAQVNGFYELSKSRMFFSMRPNASKDVPLDSLRVEADRPIEIVDLKVSGDAFRAAWKSGASKNTAIIEIYAEPGAQPGRRNETLAFSVKSAEETLPNRVQVRGVLLDLK